ncbi:MAG TPA: hypothetical protein PLB89_10765 [Flavobacteriales bacterium]|nr:hypothetical protein [Flavobacteriales bacterium]
MRTSMNALGMALIILLSVSCRKEEPVQEMPVSDVKAHPIYTVHVKRLPQGGYLLQCVDDPTYRRLDFAQLMSADGELLQRIDYAPIRAAYSTDLDKEFYITDIVPMGPDRYAVIGFGIEVTDTGYPTDLVIHQVNTNGEQVAEIIERPLGSIGITEHESFLYPTYKERAIGVSTPNGDLVVALNMGLYSGPGTHVLKLYRFPLSGPPSTERAISFTGPYDTQGSFMWSIQPSTTEPDKVLLLQSDYYLFNTLRKLAFTPTAIIEEEVDRPSFPFVFRPYVFLQDVDGTYAFGGNRVDWGQVLSGFFPQIQQGACESALYQQYQFPPGYGNAPFQCYAGAFWNGKLALLTSAYEAGVIQPYFPGDRESDLGLMFISPEDNTVTDYRTLIPGQGMRGIALFNDGGQLVVIGTNYPYENTSLHHTFFMRVKNG